MLDDFFKKQYFFQSGGVSALKAFVRSVRKHFEFTEILKERLFTLNGDTTNRKCTISKSQKNYLQHQRRLCINRIDDDLGGWDRINAESGKASYTLPIKRSLTFNHGEH